MPTVLGRQITTMLETDAKKIYYWPRNRPIIKNPQFLPNQADIQANLPTHELVIFTKFHKVWVKIVDFLKEAYNWNINIFCLQQSLFNIV